MRHTKTPTDPGWYWVTHDTSSTDNWQLAYWDAESDNPRLFCFGTPPVDVTVWEPYQNHWVDVESNETWSGTWTGPTDWFGPLQCPGGPFGSTIAEFDCETHAAAEADGKAMVMVHVDFNYTSRPFETVTVVKIVPADEADKACKAEES